MSGKPKPDEFSATDYIVAVIGFLSLCAAAGVVAFYPIHAGALALIAIAAAQIFQASP